MKNLIEDFYTSFVNLDPEGMAKCYHQDIVFTDPAFGTLQGQHASNMWRMLINSQKGKTFKIQYSNVSADEHSGKAHWEAFYNFSKTGNKVHNKIEATFEFKDGKIIKHTDHFNLHQWAKQAMGTTGLLLGWTSFFKNKLQKQANSQLADYEASLGK